MSRWRLAAVAVLVLSTRAHAQRAEAEAEFQRGHKLMSEGKYAKACEAFEASQKLDPAKGTLYNLALCHEKVGKLASAWSELVEVSRTDTNRARAKDAGRRAAALEPRLTRMRLVIAGKADGEVVLRDKLDVTALADSEVPVDPGTYTFEASAPGRASTTVEIELTEEGKTVEVRIAKLRRVAGGDDGGGGSGGGSGGGPEPGGAIDPEPASYPLDLAHRPLLIPHGMIETHADASAGMNDAYDRTGFYASASARARLGPFEARLRTGFVLRWPYVMNRPNPWDVIGLGLRYPVEPALIVGLDYAQHQPLRSERGGSDLSASVESKLLILPRVAVVGQGGLAIQQRQNPGNAFTIFGEGQVQIGITGGLSAQGRARLDLHLAGDLYTDTAALEAAALVVYAIGPQLDVFGEVANTLLPDAALHTYLVGATWRIRGG